MKRFLIALMFLLLIPMSAYADLVDLELSLLVDVSISVNDSEFALQRDGYAAAFQSNEVWSAISQLENQKIAVNFIYFSDIDKQVIGVDWTIIDSETAADNFGIAIGNTIRPTEGFGDTGIGNALVFGTNTILFNDHDGARKVIDVSGDGKNNTYVPPFLLGLTSEEGREVALGSGINTINGIVITDQENDVYAHYEAEVIGGDDPFLIGVASFNEFEAAIKEKLIREINPVPVPTAILLFGVGLLGLTGTGRRRK